MSEYHVRWLIRRDMPEVLALEKDLYGDAGWSEEQINKLMRQRNIIGKVVEDKNQMIAGYFLYELSRTHFTVLRVLGRKDDTPRPEMELIGELQRKLTKDRRRTVRAVVWQDDIELLSIMVKRLGFRNVFSEDGFFHLRIPLLNDYSKDYDESIVEKV